MAGGGGILKMLGPLGTVLTMVMRVVGGLTGVGLVAAAIYLVIKHFDVLKEKLGGMVSSIWGHVQKLGEALGRLLSADAPIGRFVRWVGDKMIGYIKFIGGIFDSIIQALTSFIDWLDSQLPGYEGRVRARNVASAQAAADENEAKISAAQKTQKAFEKLGGDKAINAMQAGIMKVTTIGKGPHRKQVVEFVDVKAERVTEQQRALYEAWKNMLVARGLGGAEQLLGKERFATMERAYGAKAPGEEEAPKGQVYQDFRNSRFDITQKFAEGFDPDRIAVGFANDIASLGEKKLSSGFTPLGSIR
jgi:hypothetical protein